MATEKTEIASSVLKECFDEARFRQVAGLLGSVHGGFSQRRFMRKALQGLEELSLIQRLRRMTESVQEALGLDYLESVEVLKLLAPKLESSLVTLFLPDFVGVYGRQHFDESMEALKYFTRFGSSEFAVREFLRLDLVRGLEWMYEWSLDEDEHVRRLASEGCRPRLPWSFRLEALMGDPRPALPILENLKRDGSLYVRKSVANHLNDISKDHPQLVLDWIGEWGLEHEYTAWIAKRALRTLIKRGDKEALALFGAGALPEVEVEQWEVEPREMVLGETLMLELRMKSVAEREQRLVIDYVIHYVKKAGSSSAKVFKWKEVVLGGGEELWLRKKQRMQNFTTRVHHAGRHRVEVMVNGEKLAETEFLLRI